MKQRRCPYCHGEIHHDDRGDWHITNCSEHLEDFRQWLQQFKGKYIVTKS